MYTLQATRPGLSLALSEKIKGTIKTAGGTIKSHYEGKVLLLFRANNGNITLVALERVLYVLGVNININIYSGYKHRKTGGRYNKNYLKTAEVVQITRMVDHGCQIIMMAEAHKLHEQMQNSDVLHTSTR